MKFLITGGTVFVSKFLALYFVKQGHEVYVLNRGTKKQVDGAKLIKADRAALNGCLNGLSFDAVIDVCAYTEKDIKNLLSENITFKDYVFISTSAVYPHTLPQPFNERQEAGVNTLWGEYSKNKLEAEKFLSAQVKGAYIIRPAYIYGPMQNLYREPFVFECAQLKRKFYIPGSGDMKLQLFYIEDLCRLVDEILKTKPAQNIINAGGETASINKFVELCYCAAGAQLEAVYVDKAVNVRSYFSFADYEYELDNTVLNTILPSLTTLSDGLQKSYDWYKQNPCDAARKPYIEYIDENLKA